MPQGTRSQETRRYESIAPRTTSVPQGIVDPNTVKSMTETNVNGANQ